MARRPIDPARLGGETLTHWYRRTSSEIEQDRDEVKAQSWRDYQFETRRQSEATQQTESLIAPAEDEGLYIATGAGGWRRIGSGLGSQHDGGPSFHPAEPQQAYFLTVGNPANPGLIRQWEKREGRPWPRDALTGRRYDVGHIKALADGGANTLENIEPIHPDAHRAHHTANGDYSRWGKRAAIARAFGGRVMRALGPIGILPAITGVLSNRIRTDNWDNFASDVVGWPSEEDRQRQLEREQKVINPHWNPGDPIVI
ncbi:HNH endonuclease signature motif containing protein [Phenylobacterium sp.]|uniref:HNH endonuclease signature motif containing protein n=1 Tax=Phenylobacterium sp. TaxID=1871053 RepID=UPI00260DCFE8|nr:HNH endonuclease signature motif containing protein [Phenylobacterium sp.]